MLKVSNSNNRVFVTLIFSIFLFACSTDGQEPYSGNEYQANELILAINSKDQEKALQLIAESKHVSARDSDGSTPLIAALLTQQPVIAQALIKAGVDIKEANEVGATALMAAVYGGQIDIFNQLIEMGAKFDKVDQDGWSALHFAAELEKDDLALRLLEMGANPNSPNVAGWTPFLAAVSAKKFEVVKAMMNKSAKVDMTNNLGTSPLMLASINDDTKMLKFLLEKEANPNLVTSDQGHTALMYASGNGNLENVRQLLNVGAKVNIQDASGWTPLSIAASVDSDSSSEIVSILLKNGADKSVVNNDGNKAIDIAVRPEVKTLLQD